MRAKVAKKLAHIAQKQAKPMPRGVASRLRRVNTEGTIEWTGLRRIYQDLKMVWRTRKQFVGKCLPQKHKGRGFYALPGVWGRV